VWTPFSFLGLDGEAAALDGARVVVLPVPYDSTTSFRAGARHGPRAIIEASYHLEDYDPELDADVSCVGIHTAPFLEPHMDGPRRMLDRVRGAVAQFLDMGKLVGLLGGEHSLTLGYVEALASRRPNSSSHEGLTVLYLDAHADLRDEYMGTRWGHASVARRIAEVCPVVQVGVRSLSQPEMAFVKDGGVAATFWPPQGTWCSGGLGPDLVDGIVDRLSRDVYITVDLDVFDPAVVPAVGTPEPGGMDWDQVTTLLRAVGERRRIVGFDVTELSPDLGPPASAYVAAKLVYKLAAYATLLPGAAGPVHPEAGPGGESPSKRVS
jgi:agmatinase